MVSRCRLSRRHQQITPGTPRLDGLRELAKHFLAPIGLEGPLLSLRARVSSLRARAGPTRFNHARALSVNSLFNSIRNSSLAWLALGSSATFRISYGSAARSYDSSMFLSSM